MVNVTKKESPDRIELGVTVRSTVSTSRGSVGVPQPKLATTAKQVMTVGLVIRRQE